MFPTETVRLLRPSFGPPDGMGEPTVSWVPERVEGVLFDPGSTEDLDETRPHGVRQRPTMHFPKGREWDLRGCLVERDGRTYRVVGDPEAYPGSPGQFSTAAPLERVDG